MNRRYRDGYRARRKTVDPARLAAFELLQAVHTNDAYANLVLPKILREKDLRGRDAAFATELAYGSLRWQGRYDALLAKCSSRPLTSLDSQVLDLLRLGAHQLFNMRIPPHAAVAETVDLARLLTSAGPTGMVNAVLRALSQRSAEEWEAELAELKPLDRSLAARYSHPDWIVRALREALVAHGRSAEELEALLTADNEHPYVTLVARPGLLRAAELAFEAEDVLGVEVAPGDLTDLSVVLSGGDPGRLPSVRSGIAAVQDEGSQLVAALVAAAPVAGSDKRWLDLCAGPGGKAALLGAWAAKRDATLVANEVSAHRAELVRDAVRALPPGVVTVQQGDGREISAGEEPFDRILVDAPCTGLGALRRRPESRWRRQPADVATLTELQEQLLNQALDVLRPGGVCGYVTCSPHVVETIQLVHGVLAKRSDVVLEDVTDLAQEHIPTAAEVGTGPTLQLWPHIHGTDAMFLALVRKTD